ncbi:hypothetical protein BKA58DRAFT_13634 [Alternaria rosae]|uniref:uncharacterized protein n=1 Tax=Alternaria rosae TaxID=1187941 RepID=UPI001E8E1092|nr:uncharacterized protein BKA58DRAFT_13634 [Alternaria rosae]KAH6882096.1 hypothetical protein BKA58DRAFT_13634 [Alternaria rosae]
MPDENQMRPRPENPSSHLYQEDEQTILAPVPEDKLAISQRNASVWPLLRLPAELRLQIWEDSMSCANVTIRHRLLWNRARSKPRGIPTNDDGTPAKDVALRLPATPRQIHAETRLLIFALITFKIQRCWQFHWVSEHALLRNIQSLCVSNVALWDWTYNFPDSTESQSVDQLPQFKIGYHTNIFPRLKHMELAPHNVNHLH